MKATAGPSYICNIDLIFSSILLLSSLLRNVVYVKKQLFCTTCCKTTQVGTLFTIHLNINIVYSKVLQALSIILTSQCDMSKQVLNKHYHGARTMQYGFRTHAVKREPIVQYYCSYLSRHLNLVYNFALRAMPTNRLVITDSKSRLRTRLLSITMRDKALRHVRQVNKANNVVVRCCLGSWHGPMSSQIFRAYRQWNSEMRFFLGCR